MVQGTSLDKLSTQRKKRVSFSGKFVPLFWDDADGRCASVKRIKRRLEALRKDANVDTTQKEILAQRATFLTLQLESMERRVAEGESIESGVYTQGLNTLLGILRALGLTPRRTAKAASLKEYLAKDGEGAES
jgi:hypothetical protein